MEFVDDNFKKELFTNVINKTFTSMNILDKEFLHKKLVSILNIVSIKFNFNMNYIDLYKKQFRINNYRDSISFLLLLLPFIDDSGGMKKKKIRSISDIYVTKKEEVDIDKKQPKYIYSNIQYGRCIRDKYTKEISFTYEHIEHNYILLKDTIQKVSHKLFVNWIDIFPVAENNNDVRFNGYIKKTLNYIENENLKEWEYWNNDDKIGYNYQGILIEDVYNFFSNHLFSDIKNYKWLIYDIKYQKKIVPYFILIQKLLYLKDCINNDGYYDISETSKKQFDDSWEQLLFSIKNNKEFNGVPKQIYSKVIIALMYFFNKYSKNIQEARKDGYKPFKADYIDEEEVDLDSLKIRYIYPSMESLKPIYLYNFIQYQFRKMKKSYYDTFSDSGTKLVESYELFFNKTELEKVYPFYYKDKNNEIILTHKNFYNFAKSITHISLGTDNYESLGRIWKELSEEYKNIFINRVNNKTSNNWFNINRYLRRLGIRDTYSYTQRMFNVLLKNIPAITVQGLCLKGMLTYFEPHPEISNMNFEQIPLKVKDFFNKNRDKLKDCYHFLTNRPYDEINIKIKNGEYNYYDYMTTYQKWYTTYAMNWVSQISFFHKYLNCRVMMVTGSTGVGKSTQIPKLLMYALKVIDYKESGSVVCTEPRRTPTENNCKRISLELGVPIEYWSDVYNRYIPNDKFYIQYKHQDNSHTALSDNLSLKIVTDGTLLTELKNPLLKKRKYDEKIKDYKYFEDNLYDIVIIDEAHEHNTNMDIILTKIRYSLKYNNSIRLVIISATMDDDEPVYRRYYRDINDNKLYPINRDLEKNSLDRINVERRLHISPPGISTRFNITEIYKPNGNPINIILSFISQSSYGDILFFQPGENEIKSSIEKLNKLLPNNTLAIPYVSKMDVSKRNIVENIDSTKNKLTRTTPYDFFMTSEEQKGGGIDRVVIVATNIAEASITISTLKYVIDTGTQKIAKYNYLHGEASLVLSSISESSRLQRKGRVGRTSPGTVVYLYEEGAMKNNKTLFNISIDNISTSIYEMMRENPDENKLIENDSDDVYFGNPKHYDYNNSKIPPPLYNTGYSEKTVIDNSGDFYIIHPEELNFNRSITGYITEKLNDEILLEKGILYSFKMESFIDKLQTMWCILRKNNSYLKTEFGIKLFRLKERLKIEDPRILLTYIFSRQYGVSYDVESIISILMTCKMLNAKPSRWFEGKIINGKYKSKFIDLYSSYCNNHGDLIALYYILKKTIKLEPLKLTNFEVADNLKEKYLNNDKLPFESFLMLKKLDIRGELSKKKQLTKKEKKLLIKDNIIYTTDINDLESKIKEKNLNKNVVLSFRKTYYSLQYQIFKKINNIYDIDLDERDDDVNIKWFDDVLSKFRNNYGIERGIIRSLLHGYQNIAVYVRKNLYIDILNPDLSSLSKIKKFHPRMPINDSLLCNPTMFILYFFKDIESEDISLIHNVTAEEIVQTNPIFFTKNLIIKRNYKFLSLPWGQFKGIDSIYKLSSDIKDSLNYTLNKFDDNSDNNFWRNMTKIVKKEDIKFVKFNIQNGGNYIYVSNTLKKLV